MPGLRQDSSHQDDLNNPQHQAENAMDSHTPSRWEANKSDIKSEEEISRGPLSSKGAAGEKLEEPSWKPHSIKAQFPDKLRPIRLTEPEKYAAGIPAVVRSMAHLVKNHSVLRGGAIGRQLEASIKAGEIRNLLVPSPEGGQALEIHVGPDVSIEHVTGKSGRQ